MAPAAALVTVGVTCTARWRGSTTPVTPAPSAERSERAEVAGVGDAVDGQQERRRAAWRATAASSSSSASGRPAAVASTPWGDSVRASAQSLARRHLAHRDAAGRRPARRCRRRPRRRPGRSATQTSRTLRRPASSSSRTAWRPSTCSPPRPFGLAPASPAVAGAGVAARRLPPPTGARRRGRTAAGDGRPRLRRPRPPASAGLATARPPACGFLRPTACAPGPATGRRTCAGSAPPPPTAADGASSAPGAAAGSSALTTATAPSRRCPRRGRWRRGPRPGCP